MMTGKTRYYGLGKYQKTDIVDIESDWNENFSKIDTQMKETANQIEEYTDTADNINNQKPTWDGQIANWRSELNVAEGQLNENSANAVTARNVAESAKVTAQKAQTDVSGADGIVQQAVAQVTNVQQTNQTVATGIQGLTLRIEALEGETA